MARMNAAIGFETQLRLIAGLRWRMFANSLRGRQGKADVAGWLIAGFFVTLGVLGAGLAMAAGAWVAFHDGRPLILAGLLWAVFLVWQLVPIFITGFGAQADLGLLLRFPLTYPAFVLLTLSYGLVDPAGIAAIFWLAMIVIGVGIAAAGALLWVIPALAVFAAVNLILSRAVFAWLDRWLAQRRTREILGVAFFVLLISFQLIRPLANRWGKQAALTIERFAPAETVSPPGLAVFAVYAGWRGQEGPALLALGSLGVIAVALAAVLGIRVKAQYRGESLSEAPRTKVSGVHKTQAGWRVVGLSPPVAALFEKDLRYLVRNAAQYITLLVPLILVFAFGLRPAPHVPGHGHAGFHAMPLAGSPFFFPAAMAYCFLIVMMQTYNALGYDGPGVAMLFAAPIRFSDVLISKNLVQTLVLAFEMTVVFAVVSLVRGRPDTGIVLVTLAAVLFALPLNFAAANLVSLHFPRKLQFGQIRRQKASGMAILIGLAVQVAIIGSSAGIYLLARWAGKLWIAGALFVSLSVVGLIVYCQVVKASGAIAERQHDVLMTELCRLA